MIRRILGLLWSPIYLRLSVKRVGVAPRLAGRISVTRGQFVTIGNHFFAGDELYVSTNQYAPISIGNAVMFGPRVMLLGGNHDLSFSRGHMRFNDKEESSAEPILIEDGAWIGAQVVLLSGANVGEGAIIGAGALVDKRVPPYAIAVGNRLRVLSCRFESAEALGAALLNCGSAYSVEDVLAEYKTCGVEFRVRK